MNSNDETYGSPLDVIFGWGGSNVKMLKQFNTMNDLETNNWKMTLHLVCNKRSYKTFLTIFLLTMPNATAQTIGLSLFIGQIAGLLLEIPSGYIADRIGYKNALVFGRVALLLSTMCYTFANSIPWFYAGAVLLAVGASFISGTSNAFMYDTLTALKREAEFVKVMSKILSVSFAVPIVLILLLAVVAETSFRLAFGVALIIDVVGLAVVLSLVNPPQKHSLKKINVKEFYSIISTFFKMPLARFVIFSALAFGISFGATEGFREPYQAMLGFSLTMLGVLWAISRLCISILLIYNNKIYELFSFKQFIILRTLVYAVAFVSIGFITNMWVVATLFIICIVVTHGTAAAYSQYNLEYIKDSSAKATLLSMGSFMNVAFSALAGLAMGALVVLHSYQVAYLIAGVTLTAIALLAGLLLVGGRLANKKLID